MRRLTYFKFIFLAVLLFVGMGNLTYLQSANFTNSQESSISFMIKGSGANFTFNSPSQFSVSTGFSDYTIKTITNNTYIGGIMLNFTLTLDNPDSASTITISTHQGFEAEFPIHNGQANVQIFVPVSFASGQQIYIFLDK